MQLAKRVFFDSVVIGPLQCALIMLYISLYMASLFNTQQAAKAAGISVMTLHRWIVGKRLDAPKLRIRNGRAVRLWGQADLTRLRQIKQQIYCKGRGRKKGYKRK